MGEGAVPPFSTLQHKKSKVNPIVQKMHFSRVKYLGVWFTFAAHQIYEVISYYRECQSWGKSAAPWANSSASITSQCHGKCFFPPPTCTCKMPEIRSLVSLPTEQRGVPCRTFAREKASCWLVHWCSLEHPGRSKSHKYVLARHWAQHK